MEKEIGKKQRIQSLYDQTSAHYDARYFEIQLEKYSSFRDTLYSDDSSLLLDVGGGTGLLAYFLKKPFIVLDISLGMLKIASENHPDILLIAADAENLPIRSNAVSLVTSFSALQNLPDREKGIQELVRVSYHRGVVTALSKIISKSELNRLLSPHSVAVTEVAISKEDVGIIFTHSSS